MGKKIILSILTAGLLLTSFPSEAATTSEYSFVDVIGDVSEVNYNRMMVNYCKIRKMYGKRINWTAGVYLFLQNIWKTHGLPDVDTVQLRADMTAQSKRFV